MVAAELLGGITAFKSIYDSAKSLKDMSDASIRNSAVIDLQAKILDAQARMGALIDECKDLEAQVSQLKSWEAEKARYELVALAPNIVAYREKSSIPDKSANHYLCANCFAVGTKSFLQQTVRGSSVDQFKCARCGEELTIDKNAGPRRAVVDYDPYGSDDGMR